MPLRGAASPMTLTVGTFWSAVDAREPPESLPVTSPSPSACAAGDESARGSVCRSKGLGEGGASVFLRRSQNVTLVPLLRARTYHTSLRLSADVTILNQPYPRPALATYACLDRVAASRC